MILSPKEAPCETCIVNAICSRKVSCPEKALWEWLKAEKTNIRFMVPNRTSKQKRKELRRRIRKIENDYIQELWKMRKNEK